MKTKSAGFASMGLIFILGGCTIHPQPIDTTGVNTFQIVQQIRCETRKSVIEKALAYLTKSPDVDIASRERGYRIDEEYKRNKNAAVKLYPKLFRGQVRDVLRVFEATGVAYNFNLDMQEDNNADGSINFGNTFTKGIFGLDFGGKFNRSRQNVRTFTVTDHFGALVQNPMDCAGRIVGPDYAYPISGQIGVDDMIRAFVYLTLFGNLAGGPEPPKGTIPKGPPTLVDALLFTTTVYGGVTPRVTFAPLGNTLSVTEASLDISASRTDKHQVVVGLALDPTVQPYLGSVRADLQAQPVAPMQKAFFGRLLTASGNRAELAAADAVDQYLTQKIFSPTITITP